MNEKFSFSDAKYLNERKDTKKFLFFLIYLIYYIDLFILNNIFSIIYDIVQKRDKKKLYSANDIVSLQVAIVLYASNHFSQLEQLARRALNRTIIDLHFPDTPGFNFQYYRLMLLTLNSLHSLYDIKSTLLEL